MKRVARLHRSNLFRRNHNRDASTLKIHWDIPSGIFTITAKPKRYRFTDSMRASFTTVSLCRGASRFRGERDRPSRKMNLPTGRAINRELSIIRIGNARESRINPR